MKARYVVLVAAVIVLAIANLWRWLPAETRRETASASAAAFRAEEFQLRAGLALGASAGSGRNLFQPRLPPAPPPAPEPPKVVEAPPPPPPPGPPPKTPEQVAEEAARDELRQLKLVGVVFRNGKGQAFVVKGSDVYMVHAGERVGERFQVQSISAEGIQLSDPASRVNGQIPVSGK
jgi:hypothetical protein